MAAIGHRQLPLYVGPAHRCMSITSYMHPTPNSFSSSFTSTEASAITPRNVETNTREQPVPPQRVNGGASFNSGSVARLTPRIKWSPRAVHDPGLGPHSTQKSPTTPFFPPCCSSQDIGSSVLISHSLVGTHRHLLTRPPHPGSGGAMHAWQLARCAFYSISSAGIETHVRTTHLQ